MSVRVALGPVAEISEATCLSVGDGRAVVVRVDGEVRAFRNRCLHQDSPLDGGWIRDGVLSCPLHFWRYRADDGRLIGTRRSLEQFPVEVVDGEAFAVLPDVPAPVSLREQLLARAQQYDRTTAYEADCATS